MHAFRLLTALALTTVAACAHGPDVSEIMPPNYAPIPGTPPPANARLYTDCMVQAAANATYVRASDGGGEELILFTCTDAPAMAFYDALGPWSARIGSTFEHEGRSYRSTTKVQRNLFGVDSCSTQAGADPRCVISFNAGDFLDQ